MAWPSIFPAAITMPAPIWPGFSVYADIGLAIRELRRTGRLGGGDKIVYVDLDAHQGNGICRTFMGDARVFIYDQYNALNFPLISAHQRQIDCDVAARLRLSREQITFPGCKPDCRHFSTP